MKTWAKTISVIKTSPAPASHRLTRLRKPFRRDNAAMPASMAPPPCFLNEKARSHRARACMSLGFPDTFDQVPGFGGGHVFLIDRGHRLDEGGLVHVLDDLGTGSDDLFFAGLFLFSPKLALQRGRVPGRCAHDLLIPGGQLFPAGF